MLLSLTLARRERTASSLWVGLLCIDFLAWTFAAEAYRATSDIGWHAMDLAFAPWVPTLGLGLISSLVQRNVVRRRQWISVAYTSLGVSVIGVLPAVLREVPMRLLPRHVLQEATYLMWEVLWTGGLALLLVATLWLGYQWLKQHGDGARRSEGRRLLVVRNVLVVTGSFALTEVLADLGMPIVRLGHLAGASFATALLWLGIAHRLFPKPKRWAALLTIAATACFCYAMWFAVSVLSATEAYQLVFVLSLAILLPLALFLLVTEWSTRLRGVSTFAFQGRMAAQLAHDIRNPLAAMHGAIDVWREEGNHRGRENGANREVDGQLIRLLAEQIDRLQRTTDTFLRMTRLRVALRDTSTDELAEVIADAFPELDIASDGRAFRADVEMLNAAFLNLVRNAVEASPQVRVELTVGDSVELLVEDGGAGMSHHEQELALQGLYTTKSAGTGLGLAFARRVAEAHQGTLVVRSEMGEGTTVHMTLPR